MRLTQKLQMFTAASSYLRLSWVPRHVSWYFTVFSGLWRVGTEQQRKSTLIVTDRHILYCTIMLKF